jgi:hypothetical protein
LNLESSLFAIFGSAVLHLRQGVAVPKDPCKRRAV